MTRQEIKTMWLNLPTSKVVKKTILVKMTTNKFHWIGYGNVSINSEGPNGYSHFSTHQEHPVEYALNTKEYKSGEYSLVIK